MLQKALVYNFPFFPCVHKLLECVHARSNIVIFINKFYPQSMKMNTFEHHMIFILNVLIVTKCILCLVTLSLVSSSALSLLEIYD